MAARGVAVSAIDRLLCFLYCLVLELYDSTATHTHQMVVMGMAESVLIPLCPFIWTGAARQARVGQKLDRAEDRCLANARIHMAHRLNQLPSGDVALEP